MPKQLNVSAKTSRPLSAPLQNSDRVHSTQVVCVQDFAAPTNRFGGVLSTMLSLPTMNNGIRLRIPPDPSSAGTVWRIKAGGVTRQAGCKAVQARADARAADLAPTIADVQAAGARSLHAIAVPTSGAPHRCAADG
jgi:hypothetical protein